MHKRLSNKVAIVVGGGSSGEGWGNGKATAVLFAREGAQIFVVDRDIGAAQATCDVIAAEGGTCQAARADVSNATDVEGMVNDCVATFGRVDILHNNVGILEVGGPVETSQDSWNRVLQVNLTSVYLTCKYVVPLMVAQGSGAIVNVASIAGIRYLGTPYAAYAASKAGITGLTRNIALQYASCGIRANCVLPGFMDTPMIRKPLSAAFDDEEELTKWRNARCPTGRMGDAWDTAHAALFLASDEARYITAHDLVVDGGLTARCV